MVWIAFLFVAVKYVFHPMHDPDLWWHLANGRFMMESHEFLRKDVFSHTLFGAPWINFEWLSEIIVYEIARTTGLTGLFWAKSALGLLSLGLSIAVIRVAGASGLVWWLLSFLGYHVLQARICNRIELATLVLFPTFTLLILQARAGRPFLRKYLPWILGALMVAWCNLHAGFIYGIGFVILLNLGARWSNEERNFIRTLDTTVVTILLGAVLNPYGIRIGEIYLRHLLDFQAASGLLQEWDATTIAAAPAFWCAFVLSGITMIQGVFKKRRSLFIWVPAVVVFAAWGGTYLRNTAIFAFVCLPFLAEAWKDFSLVKSLNSRPGLRWTGWTIGLALLIAVNKDYFTHPISRHSVEWWRFPVHAARFVERENIQGRMYNPLGFGGYLAWETGPERKIFMDGRYIFYPLVVESQYLKNGRKFQIAKEPWQKFFSAYGVDYAIDQYDPLQLIPAPGELVGTSITDLMYPRDQWALVFWDDAAMVFVKRIPKFQHLIDRLEYRALVPYHPDQFYVNLKTGVTDKAAAAKELARHDTEVKGSFREAQMRFVLRRAG